MRRLLDGLMCQDHQGDASLMVSCAKTIKETTLMVSSYGAHHHQRRLLDGLGVVSVLLPQISVGIDHDYMLVNLCVCVCIIYM